MVVNNAAVNRLTGKKFLIVLVLILLKLKLQLKDKQSLAEKHDVRNMKPFLSISKATRCYK